MLKSFAYMVITLSYMLAYEAQAQEVIEENVVDTSTGADILLENPQKEVDNTFDNDIRAEDSGARVSGDAANDNVNHKVNREALSSAKELVQPVVLTPESNEEDALTSESQWQLFGALRTAFVQRWPALERPYVGHDDGFELDQARLGVVLPLSKSLEGFLQLDFSRGAPREDGVGGVLLDASLKADIIENSLWLKIGQQFMPGPLESQRSRREMVFTNRSVVSSGVNARDGYALLGTGTARELGLVLGGTFDNQQTFGLNYRLGISNGDLGTNNQDDSFALYASLGLRLKDIALLSIGAHQNARRLGDAIIQRREAERQAFADLELKLYPFVFHSGYVMREVAPVGAFVGSSVEDAAQQFRGWVLRLITDQASAERLWRTRFGARMSELKLDNAVLSRDVRELAIAVWHRFKGEIDQSVRLEWLNRQGDPGVITHQATVMYQLIF